ncbi:MAG: class I SAM-dependent methyltransferase [Hyphomicrobiales bacterium]|nr:class I SAM-dependent methyltransferase [Hyphomicrobiales bacterium]MCP5001361.1 class I SAM-dependent methyltransferase [Hyphomicrobiales bacterium]
MKATTIRHDTTKRHVAKYTNQNLLHRLSLGKFHDALAKELGALAPKSVLDFGCGEGFVLDELASRGVDLEGYKGLDLRADALAEARSRWPSKQFVCADVFDSEFDTERFDVTIAFEVFEHLFDPDAAMRRLVTLTDRALVVTVPHEPWFQLVNLARGRDFIRLGNHPEHVQHWNPSTFADFINQHAELVSIRRSFPFIVATARPRK